MQRARAGFTSYPVHCLGKSGVFAAYAAQGLLPIVVRTGENDDGLVLGRTMAAASRMPHELSLEDMAQIAAGAHAWYRPHNVRETASCYAIALTDALAVSQTEPARLACL